MTDPAHPLDLPDRRLFWQWVWSAVRPVLGWVLAALGGLALLLGWYGVSGEALTAKQLPYVVSGGLTGVALVILAGVFLATDDVRRQLARIDSIERKVDALVALLTEEARADTGTEVVALPAGTSYHRPGCSLVAGKTSVQPLTAEQVAERGLTPCRVCDPVVTG